MVDDCEDVNYSLAQQLCLCGVFQRLAMLLQEEDAIVRVEEKRVAAAFLSWEEYDEYYGHL